MLTRFYVELKKSRHRNIFLLLLVLLGVAALWLSFSLSSISDKSILMNAGYYNVLYQFPMINTILLPLFLAVLASRIWDSENKGNTYKLLCTLEKRGELYHSKTFFGAVLIFFVTAGETAIIPLLGMAYHLKQPLPGRHLLFFFLATFLSGIMLYLLQQIISFRFENQLGALTLGLIGSFAGLFSLFFPRQISFFVISSYFSLMQTVGMNWDRATRAISFYEVPFSIPYFFWTLFLAVFIYLIGRLVFARKEL